MNPAMYAIRFIFILTAVISTLYLGSIDSYSEFTFASLLFITIDAFYRKRKGAKFALWIIALQISYSLFLSYAYGGFMYLLFYAVLFSFQPERWKSKELLLLLLQWTAMNLVLYQEPVSVLILSNLMYLAILAVQWLIGNTARQKEEIQFLYDSLRKNHYELDEARSTLVEYAQRVETVAQMEERNRISKEIHDELGHRLIRIKMMMEALILILPKDLQRGMDMLYQIRDHLSTSMETLRTTVRKLKPGDQMINSFSLRQLVQDFAKDSGVEVELAISGQPRVLYPSEEVALYRNAQEALTNAVRHGAATHIHIQLRYLEDRVEMAVSNNGIIPEGTITKGLGMRGMEERLSLVGGSVRMEISGHFSIISEIPYKEH